MSSEFLFWLEPLLWVGLGLALIAFGFGLLLLFWLQAAFYLKRSLDRWFSAGERLQWLDRRYRSEGWFYRHHHGLGLLILVLTIAVLYTIAFYLKGELQLQDINLYPEWLPFWQWLYQATLIFLVVGHLFGFGVGVVVYFRPSQLKQLEQSANRWIDSKPILDSLDCPRTQLDELLYHYARVSGLLLCGGALYLFLLIITLLQQVG